jgi:flavin reductase (DIM6/NTAB) family NADH-FMN oxidoreductase RutF
MPIDTLEFRKVLAQFASGVTVVTTRDAQERPHGLTVSAFCSVSLQPALVLICVDQRSDAHSGFQSSGLFGVSVLSEAQEHVSRHFAIGGPEKFIGLELQRGEHGTALVPDALAHLECKVVAAHPAGDHTIYVGQVLALRANPGRPLVYQRGDYRRLEPA